MTKDATAEVHAGTAPFGRVYFCQHLTPELIWRPEWRRHSNTALSIARILIAVRDPAASVGVLKQIFGPDAVRSALAASGRGGVAILDTGSRLDRVALAALAAADLTLVPVRDPVSLRHGDQVWEQAGASAVRAVLYGVDLKIKLGGPDRDVLALLLTRLREARRNHFATVISRSPAVEALTCASDGRLRTILHGAPRSVVYRQMHALTTEVLDWLAANPRIAAGTRGPAIAAEPPPAQDISADRPRWFQRGLPWGPS